MPGTPRMDAERLRARIEDDLDGGRWGLARQHIATLWERDPTMAAAGYLLRCQERMRGHVALVPYRVAVLRSFTVEPLVPLLRAGAFAGGIDLAVHVGGFNAYGQEILDPDSSLYRFQPAMAILAVQAGDLSAGLERAAAGFREYVEAFRAHSDAALVVHDLEGPGTSGINEELRRLASTYPGVYVLPYADLVGRHGAGDWADARNQASMRMPIANASLIHLVRQWLRFIHPLSGRICKALVTDLDNTLWGGVLGEDGPPGIVCGPEGPGRRHHALQEALLELHARGILLALCSKNDEADAREVLETHEGLLLRPSHFAAMRINWRDKPANLREIASELNVGIDALAYMDDDPVELERVRSELPEVTLIELPPESDRRADSVRAHPAFARLTLQPEDRARQRYYAEQRSRVDAREKAPSLEAFYFSLEQEVVIERMTRETAERAAQLTQKTNQFNLTTRRYNTAELVRLAEGGEAQVFTVRVKDCYGDNGLTGLAIVRDTPARSEIDTFLLSCRVIGRGVEVAMLAFLSDRARGLRLREVRGSFVPTRKNGQVAGFFPGHGFQQQEEGPAGTAWAADPSLTRIQCPPWIRLTVAEGALA